MSSGWSGQRRRKPRVEVVMQGPMDLQTFIDSATKAATIGPGSGGPSPTAKPGELPLHADLRYGPPRLERPKANGTKARLRASHFRNGRDCAQRIPNTFRATWRS